jgi:8-hydroxy-5-deazaflavin:NADPH oxidoreductase
MTSITIIGAGNIAAGVARIALDAGAQVQVLARDAEKAAALGESIAAGTVGDAITGDLVVLALPYPAIPEVLAQYAGQLDGKVLVDPTNPVDFATFDSLVVPADSSAAAEIAALAPGARVVKAFNTNFASTLASGKVADQSTTVLVAGDDNDAKSTLVDLVRAGGLKGVDAGSLKRARELEALGFVQMTLAGSGATQWTTGFTLAD